jgi:hypothetical protein
MSLPDFLTILMVSRMETLDIDPIVNNRYLLSRDSIPADDILFDHVGNGNDLRKVSPFIGSVLDPAVDPLLEAQNSS